jgi:hypothetical protein
VIKPRLTFFVELESDELEALFAQPEVSDFLVQGGHALSMGLLDLDRRRASVIRALQAASVPVTAWLLLTSRDGYWLTADNAEVARTRYREVMAWAKGEGLTFARVGLDIEAPKKDLDRLLENPLAGALERLRLRRTPEAIRDAEQIYRELVLEIHKAGQSVESYQFPVIVDERKALSMLVRRMLGIVDVATDAEVLMLYQSYFGKSGVRSYFPDAQHIALGVTGGGVNADRPQIEPKLTWAELESDLLAAARCTQSLYVFSLEGCVEQDMLPALQALDWNKEPPLHASQQGLDAWQRTRRFLRWACENERLIDRVLPGTTGIDRRPAGFLSRLLSRQADRGRSAHDA